mgnify:CR=1 FL=1
MWVRFEGLEETSIGNTDGGNGPRAGGIDQRSIRIEQVDIADIGQRADPGLEHEVNVWAGHPAHVVLAGIDPSGLHIGNEVVLDDCQILELLIEVLGQ